MDKPRGRQNRRRPGRRDHHRRPQNHHDGSFKGESPSTPQSEEVPEIEMVDSQPASAPAQPPLATRKFSELLDTRLVHPTIVQTITDDIKFEYMTPVQAATLDELLPPKRSDCLVQAKTGTGKTVAFLLPAIETMLNQQRGPDSPISILVISPTRELAMQIANEGSNLLKRLPQYRVRIAIGGTNKDREEKQILNGCDILIATPGRLFDHMSNEDILYALRHVDTLVLDEADRLLDMGFMKALRDIVSNLPDKKETNRQGMLFSATIAPHVKQVAGLVLNPGYKFISTIPEGEVNTHKRVPQILIKVPTFSDSAAAMVASIRQEAAQHQDFKAILFAPTAALADFYGQILSSLPGLPTVLILHSRMTQNKRTKTTNEYRDSPSAILVATDVVARGMDFPGVTTVFQVGIPADKQSYIHRLGRTARADADGRGIFIVSEEESWFPRWTLKDITFTAQDPNLSAADEVNAIVEKLQDEDRAKIYQAWLGYYNNHLRAFKWDKADLVAAANVFASDGLMAPETPALAKTTVGKMGLRGVRGLVVVPDPPRHKGRGQGGRGKQGN